VTSPCSFTDRSFDQTGSWFLNRNNCTNLPGTDLPAIGCNIQASPDSAGDAFNNNGGGVYAMALEGTSIRTWIFQASQIPQNFRDNNPNVSYWGTPVSNFETANGGCDIQKLFTAQTMVSLPTFNFSLISLSRLWLLNTNLQFTQVFKIDICGEWPEGIWNLEPGNCQEATGFSSCRDFAANQPEAFEESFFAINSIKIFNH
jgi:hypothetical protein